MNYKISLEDLVANLFIENFKNNDIRRFLTYSEIEDYGKKVTKNINKTNDTVILELSRARTNQMLQKYSEFFEEKNINKHLGIALKETKNINDLINEFRGYLTLKLLKCFILNWGKYGFENGLNNAESNI